MKLSSIRRFLRAVTLFLVVRPLVRLLLGVHIEGWENLGLVKQFIMIANHNSHLDVVLLVQLLSAREINVTHVVAEETYFARSRLVFCLVSFLFQPIWIIRGSATRRDNVLQGCVQALQEGSNLIIFPEGTRGEPGKIRPFKSGIGRLVSQFPDIPIVPVFLSGPERALPKNCMIPLPFWNQIVIGPPQVCSGPHHDVTQHLELVMGGLSQMPHLRRHGRTRLRRKSALTVAVIGIDGSGKSSISNWIAQEFSERGCTFLVSDKLECFEGRKPNPFQPFGLDAIRQILSRRAKRAGSLEGYKLPKLTELLMRDYLLKEVERWYAASVIVQDGSPLLNMAGWAALYHGPEPQDDMLIDGIAFLAGRQPESYDVPQVCAHFPELNILSRLGLNRLRLPDAYVLLDLSPPLACKRIQQRGKQVQPHETLEKLTQLRNAYLRVERVVSEQWNVPSLVLDGDQDLKVICHAATHFLKENLDRLQKGLL